MKIKKGKHVRISVGKGQKRYYYELDNLTGFKTRISKAKVIKKYGFW